MSNKLPPSATHISSNYQNLHEILGAKSAFDILGSKPDHKTQTEQIPLSYEAVFTPMGKLHNSRAVISTKIYLDLFGAVNFCQLFRYAWPRKIPARVQEMMEGQHEPVSPRQEFQPLYEPGKDPSAAKFFKTRTSNEPKDALEKPISLIIDFIFYADRHNLTDLGMLAAGALYRFNRTCNNWPILADRKLNFIRTSMQKDPLAADRDRPTRNTFDAIELKPTQNHQASRVKRIPPAIAAGGGFVAGSLLTGLYFWIKEMVASATLAEHAEAINTLNHNSNLAKRAIRAVNQKLELRDNIDRSMAAVQNIHNAADVFEQNIEMFEYAYSNAVTGQLTLGAITTTDLNNVYKFALDTAYENGYYLPITSASDLLNLPTTAKTVFHTQVIEFAIPVADYMLDMFRLTPTPIVAEDGTADPILINIEAKSDIIAATDGKSDHQGTAPITPDFLQSCISVSTGHVCYYRLGLNKDPHTCIEALFSRSRAATAEMCTFKRNPNTWAVALAPDNVVHIATTKEMNATVQCTSRRGDNNTEVTFKKGSAIHKLPSGCTVTNDQFSVAGLPFQLGTVSIQKSVTLNMHTDILKGSSINTLNVATATFKEHGQKPPEIIEDLLDQFKHLPMLPVDTAFRSTWNTFFICILILIIGGICLYCYIKHVRGSTRRHKHYSRQAYTDLATMINGEEVHEEAFIPKKPPRKRIPRFTDVTRATGRTVNRILGRHQDYAQPSPATRARRAMLAARRPQPPPRPDAPPVIKSYNELLRAEKTNEYMELREARAAAQAYDTATNVPVHTPAARMPSLPTQPSPNPPARSTSSTSVPANQGLTPH